MDGQISNSLIAYAVLAEDFEKTQDISTGIVKLFLPILAKMQGKMFDKEVFISEAQNFLDIDIHAYAVDYLTPVLEKQGYIKEISGVFQDS